MILGMELERLIPNYSSVAITTWPTALPQCSIHSSYSNEIQSGIVRDASYGKGKVNVAKTIHSSDT